MRTIILHILLSLCLTIFFGCDKKNSHNECPVSTWNTAFDSLLYTDTHKAKAIADRLMSQAADSTEYYEALSFKVLTYMALNEQDSMNIATKRIIGFSRKKGQDTANADYRKMMCNVYNAKGIVYSLDRMADSAYKYLKLTIRYAEPAQMPQAYMNLADYHTQQGNYVRAARNYRRALTLNDSLGNVVKPYLIFNGLAMTYMQISEYDEAKRYLDKSEAYFNEMSDMDRYVLLNSYGNLFYFKSDYKSALPYFQKAADYSRKEYGRNLDSYVPVFNLAEIYILLHDMEKAEECIDTLTDVVRRFDLPVFNAHLHTLQLALATENDDIAKADRIIKQMEGEYLPIELYRIRSRYLQQYYAKKGNFRKAYSTQSENRRMEDSLRNIQVKTRVADIYMRYQQDTTLLAQRNYIETQKTEIQRTRVTAFLWIVIAVLLAVIAVTVYLLMRRQREKIVARHIEHIGKMRMENIRNCLSPHFTFNVLNHEIANYADNDPRRRQLMSLVKILRRSVEVSSQMTVTLEQELDFVNTYVQLECGQWGDDFKYVIDIGDVIDTSSFIIPSMFIQIPVENAVKHGLRAIEGKKLLEISISKESDGITVSIVNNGTGYQPRLGTSGTGKGLQVIYQTILLLNNKNTSKIRFEIGKNEPDNKDNGGTKVQYFFPSGFDYSCFSK